MQIYRDFDLSQILWYKIGGKAKYLLACSGEQDALDAVSFVKKNNISKIFVVGIGANLLFTDSYFDGVVIQMIDPKGKDITLEKDNLIKSFAGETLDSVIQFGFSHHLTGLEWAGGLPGTVGAAVRGNVGAFSGEIKNSIVQVMAIDKETLKKKIYFRDELHFAYRHSLIKENKNLLIVSVTLQLKNASPQELEQAKQTYLKNIAYREKNHPHDYPNSGSTFKNISGKENIEKILTVWPDIKEMVDGKWHGKIAMGYVNNRLGFSGFRIGNAEVSTKHANFINNLGGAKASDVKQIISTIQEIFQETFGFTPETEVEIVQ